MGRGKYHRRKTRREERSWLAAADRLRDEIAAETARLCAERARAAATATAQQRLTRERATTRRRLSPIEAAAEQAVQDTATAWHEVRDALAAAWRADRALSAPSRALPEQAATAGLQLAFPKVHHSAPAGYRKTWYRKQVGTDFPHRHVLLEGWIPDHVGDAAYAAYALSTATAITPQACWVWGVPPWFATPDGADAPGLRADLGATIAGGPVLAATAFPGPHLPADAAITLPWRHRPLLDQPSDAADLAYWFHRSAHAQAWPLPAPPVPFWLPVEHSTAYPAAHPLPAGTELRLPFPTVFACFAQPWDLPARRDAHELRHIPILHARGLARGRAPRLEQVLHRLQVCFAERQELPSPLQAIEHFGAHVDGLLLTAGPDGTPRDEFAWCLAIRHPLGAVLGRIVVPASRTATAWRTEVDNVLAGIALSAWHTPDTTTPDPPTAPAAPKRPHVGSEQPGVRVLDIDAISPATTRSHQATTGNTSSPRPHLRRGHWRRQRIGRGRHHTQWTWVRPTSVNASSAALRGHEQVYWLQPPNP